MKTEFTLTRHNWIRGEGPANSYLLRSSDGKMCCIGQFLKQQGCADAELENVDTASAISTKPEAARFLTYMQTFGTKTYTDDSHIAIRLYEANDKEGVDPIEQEQDIKDLFAEAGVHVNIVD